jgi:hypothetical protein
MFPEGTSIDASRARYPTSVSAIHLCGFIDIGNPTIARLIWIDGLITMDEAERIRIDQKVNKIPCMDYICYKSTLFSELNRLRCEHPKIMEFYPPTYLLPSEFPEFQRFHSSLCSKTQVAPFWVIKPRIGSCGKGIKLVQSTFEASTIVKPSIAQLMVDPLLLNGLKFDFRFYVLIASLEPFTCFLYREGIARFCTEPYQPPTKATRDDKYRNLTNTAVNVGSNRPPEEFTRMASEVMAQIVRRYPQAAHLWDEICDVCRMLMGSLYPTIMATLPRRFGQRDGVRLSPAQRFFHIFGVDIIIDADRRPKLLELNDRPSLSVTVAFEGELKTGMLREAFYHISADGSVLGETPESKWQQILPAPVSSPIAGMVRTVMRSRSNVKYTGRMAGDGPSTERMVMTGIKQELHQELRERAMQLKEDGKMPRFRHYLKTGSMGIRSSASSFQ